VPEIEHHSITEAVFQWNPFWSGLVVVEMSQRVQVGADVIAQFNAVTGGEPRRTQFGRADPFRELLPRLVHFQCWLHDSWKGDHAVVDGHTEID
jgi:hypothetical protein